MLRTASIASSIQFDRTRHRRMAGTTLPQLSRASRKFPFSIVDRMVDHALFPPWELPNLTQVRKLVTAKRLGAQKVELDASNGAQLWGWWFPAETTEHETTLLFPGTPLYPDPLTGKVHYINRGSYLLDILFIRKHIGGNVLIMDHRGIGGGKGFPSVESVLQDTRLVYDAVLEGRSPLRVTDPHDINLFGGSFGAALAIDLATERRCKALVTYGGFDSFRRMRLEHKTPFWHRIGHRLLHPFMDNLLESVDKVPRLKTSCWYLIHGLQDELLHTSSLVKLKQAAELAAIPHGFHIEFDGMHANTLHRVPDDIGKKIRAFIDEHSNGNRG